MYESDKVIGEDIREAIKWIEAKDRRDPLKWITDFLFFFKKGVDKSRRLCYYIIAPRGGTGESARVS